MKTPVTQRSACYSAVSALLMNPLPDRYNICHFSHTHYLTPDQYFTSLFRPDPLPSSSAGNYVLVLHCCSALLQNLVGNSEETLKQAEASVDVPYLPLQIVNSIPFCLFSLYLYPLSSPSLPSLLSLLINSL